jgi:hypothetical protein
MRERIVFGVVLAAACGDGGGGQGGDETTGSGGIASLDDGGSDETGTSSADGDSTGVDSSGGDEPCVTVLCGDPLVCCADDEDCAAGACVPACESGVRCGEDASICCEAGEVCVDASCVAPTGACLDSFDCEIGEFCEPTLGQCLPQFDPVTCAYEPDFEEIEVTLEWSYTDDQSISMPVIADLDGDGSPEVAVAATQLGPGGWVDGELVVLDGTSGAVKWRVLHDPANGSHGLHGRATLGIADVSGDDLPDIVYAGRPTGNASVVHAVDGDGDLLWSSHDADGAPYGLVIVNGAPAFANFDDDDAAEIVWGAAVIDDDGLVVWDEGGNGNGATYGTNSSYTGGVSAVVDLDGDGHAEIVSGRHAWSVDWQAGPTVTLTQLWDAGGADGYPAIADLDADGDPEVVLVAAGDVRVLDGATGLAWCGVDPTDAMCVADPSLRTAAIAIPGGGRGGPPTIADFDGDGRPEIAAAGGGSYSVYDLARAGEDIVQPMDAPEPEPGAIYVRWSQQTQDQSSNATGSSVFDFQGDGIAEVVYADECYMRVYSGLDGTIILEEPNSSATIHEYPLVVDIDADGNSEIVVVANNGDANCAHIEGYESRQGVFVYGDAFDRWVQTRRVWTSHTYHVTDATSAGTHAPAELDNWTQPGLNNYRQNVQGEGVFNAPDLTVELAIGVGGCLDEELNIIATVRNIGALGVPAGVEVSLFAGTDATGDLIGTMPTPDPLLPGASVELVWVVEAMQGGAAQSYFVAVDGDDAEAGIVAECDESNNDALTESAACPIPG